MRLPCHSKPYKQSKQKLKLKIIFANEKFKNKKKWQ